MHGKFRKIEDRGFTILELLVVVAIIAVLAGLVLSVAGFVQTKAARARTEAEVAGMEAALTSYKAEMGDYPAGTNGTPTSTNTTPGASNIFLRQALAPNGSNSYNPYNKVFFEFSKSMSAAFSTNAQSDTNQAVYDPFGNAYGYVYPGTMTSSNYYDLWSTAGSTNGNAWIKNW